MHVLNTEALVDNQIKDFRDDTNTLVRLPSLHRHPMGNSADRDPFVPVDSSHPFLPLLQHCRNLGDGGRLHGMMLLSANNIFCLMEKHHMKGGSECHLADQLFRLEQRSNNTLFLRKTRRDFINWVP